MSAYKIVIELQSFRDMEELKYKLMEFLKGLDMEELETTFTGHIHIDLKNNP